MREPLHAFYLHVNHVPSGLPTLVVSAKKYLCAGQEIFVCQPTHFCPAKKYLSASQRLFVRPKNLCAGQQFLAGLNGRHNWPAKPFPIFTPSTLLRHVLDNEHTRVVCCHIWFTPRLLRTSQNCRLGCFLLSDLRGLWASFLVFGRGH